MAPDGGRGQVGTEDSWEGTSTGGLPTYSNYPSMTRTPPPHSINHGHLGNNKRAALGGLGGSAGGGSSGNSPTSSSSSSHQHQQQQYVLRGTGADGPPSPGDSDSSGDVFFGSQMGPVHLGGHPVNGHLRAVSPNPSNANSTRTSSSSPPSSHSRTSSPAPLLPLQALSTDSLSANTVGVGANHPLLMAAAFNTTTTSNNPSSNTSTSFQQSPLYALFADPLWWIAAGNQLMFLLSSAGISLVSQELWYSGSADEWSMLVVLTQYLGMVTAYFLPPNFKPEAILPLFGLSASSSTSSSSHASSTTHAPTTTATTSPINTGPIPPLSPKYHSHPPLPTPELDDAPRTLFPPLHFFPQVLLLAILDILANTLVTIGIFVAGAGLHQVVYGAVVPLTAVLSGWLGRRRKIARRRWLAILAVAAGMGMSGWQAGRFEWAGVALNLGGTVAYAFVAALTEKIFEQTPHPHEPPHPIQVCTWVGSTSLVLLSSYLLFYTIPNWTVLVTEPVLARHTHSAALIIFLYIFLTALHFSLNLSYYTLLSDMGAVSTNVLNGLAAAVVLVGGHSWFCARDGTQCLDSGKVVGCAVVAVGCVVYAMGDPGGGHGHGNNNGGARVNNNVAGGGNGGSMFEELEIVSEDA